MNNEQGTVKGITISDVAAKIIEVRKMKVILDSDVAFLYAVDIRKIKQSIKNNPAKFPADYIISLNDNEAEDLQSKVLTANSGKSGVMPKAFTEKGLYMLATILRSPQATLTSLVIIETFAKMREQGEITR